MKDKISNLWQVIGDTPMIELSYRYHDGPERVVLVKCENERGLTGCIKDRVALYILQRAYELGTIKPGDMIVEPASGNMAIAFAAIGKALGHPVRIIMPEGTVTENMEVIKSFGGQVDLMDGGMLECIKRAELLQHDERVFLPRQFENEYNAEAHEKTTGREIYQQLLLAGIKNPYAFIAGVGSGGTVMGVGKCLKLIFPEIKIHPLEPAESPGKNGAHRIPAILDLQTLDKVIQVSDGDAILMAQRMGKDLGLAVGISSGANLVGAIKVQQENGSNRTVITIFPDSNKKYRSTDLMKKEPPKEGYITPDIKLTRYRVMMEGE